MQGEVFAAFAATELENERARRAALDARGASIVTASASLGTLVAGFASLATRSTTYHPSDPVVFTSVAALVSFVAAAALGLWGNRTVPYDVADAGTLKIMATERWASHDVDASNIVMRINVSTLDSLREGNNRKARTLSQALSAQLAAAAFLGLSAALSLLSLL